MQQGQPRLLVRRVPGRVLRGVGASRLCRRAELRTGWAAGAGRAQSSPSSRRSLGIGDPLTPGTSAFVGGSCLALGSTGSPCRLSPRRSQRCHWPPGTEEARQCARRPMPIPPTRTSPAPVAIAGAVRRRSQDRPAAAAATAGTGGMRRNGRDGARSGSSARAPRNRDSSLTSGRHRSHAARCATSDASAMRVGRRRRHRRRAARRSG